MIDIDKIEKDARYDKYLDTVHVLHPTTVLEMVALIRKQREVMQEVLRLLGPTSPECSGCAAEWDMAIKSLEEALK